jgi:signal transduction histidine kinase
LEAENPNLRVSQEEHLLTSDATQPASSASLPLHQVTSLLDLLDRPMLVADRAGRVLFANQRARNCLESKGLECDGRLNLFRDLLLLESSALFGQLESGEQEVDLPVACQEGEGRARIKWLPDADWLIVSLNPLPTAGNSEDAQMRSTLQDLLQEREITYRNLLAAYLRLQEVNRQKTVFLASAAHELKTPLAVMKGYYDLLLSSSLGKLNDRQREILQDSKESCERLVRVVSMFLNYSALESGKLVLHQRENDLRDCLAELGNRWHDAFIRKKVRLETHIEPDLPVFRFDYQKVQQSLANLLDNALKHTPSGGSVTLTAAQHFWERRAAEVTPSEERRRQLHSQPNSVLICVADTGSGIAVEYHQAIFEEFVRVDRSSSGMGLGLAIAKRLVQAHRGKIWVDSEPGRGANFSILLPTELE